MSNQGVDQSFKCMVQFRLKIGFPVLPRQVEDDVELVAVSSADVKLQRGARESPLLLLHLHLYFAMALSMALSISVATAPIPEESLPARVCRARHPLQRHLHREPPTALRNHKT